MYTDAQKAAYWKRQAQLSRAGNPAPRKAVSPPPARQVTPRKRANLKNDGIGHHIGSYLGSALGSAIAPGVGGPIGSFLGGKIGHLAESIAGFGDYQVRHNSIMFGGMDPPIVENTVNKGGVVIRHREYIGDITSSEEFFIRKFPINPGNLSTFPWLAGGPAKSWETYRLQGMLFEFVSTSSDAVLSSDTNSSLGTINMATDYDALDDPYPDKQAMLNAEFSNSGKPSCNLIHPIECKKSLTPITELYVSDGTNLPANADPRLNDIGAFYIATEGQQQSGGVLGELWVTYEVFLMKVQFKPTPVLTDHYQLNGVTSSLWLNGAIRTNDSTMKGTIEENTTYYFPSDQSQRTKYFLVTISLFGSSAGVIGSCTPFLANATLVDVWHAGGTTLVQSPAATANSAQLMSQFVVRLRSDSDDNDDPSSITFDPAAVPGGTVNGDFYVTEIADVIPDATPSSKKKKHQSPPKRLI